MHPGSDLSTLFTEAARLARGAGRGALATVVARKGSLPMSATAKMLVRSDGARWGTIGGGCLEGEITEIALEVAATAEPVVVERHLNADLAGDIGLTCGGTVELFVEPVFPDRALAELYAGAASMVEEQRPAVCVTGIPWRNGPAKVLIADGAIVAGRLDGHAETALELAARGDESAHRARLGEGEAVVEPLLVLPSLVIFGGGHVGFHIARVAQLAGFKVTVMDDRGDYANGSRFPGCRVIAAPYHDILSVMALPREAFVVITTRGHEHDAVVLEQVLQNPPRYVGMIGSRRKAALTFRALAARGMAAERLARVRSPVGLAIGADGPGEIAVSIVAQLVAERRGVSTT